MAQGVQELNSSEYPRLTGGNIALAILTLR